MAKQAQPVMFLVFNSVLETMVQEELGCRSRLLYIERLISLPASVRA